MKRKQILTITATMLIALFALLAIGCSSQNPVTSNNESLNLDNSEPMRSQGSIDWYGLVTSLNSETREIAISSHAELIVVAEGAEIVFKDGGIETPIELSEILVSDSIEARGTVQGDGTLLADRVRIRAADDNGANEVEIKGRVESIDAVARTMTIVGDPTLINVLANAEVVHKVSGAELPITLDQIMVGDSVDVRGDIQTDGSLAADRVRLRENEDFNSDLEFTSTITSIDYENSTMTVESRTETIHIDANTYIYTKEDYDKSGTTNFSTGDGSDDDSDSSDVRIMTEITLAHLTVGDTVEVHANVIDASNLYAVTIELEDGAFENQNKVEFKDFLATVDSVTGIVTFQNQTWTGQVVSGTVLLGYAEEIITIDMFSPGEIVEIKGFPTSESDLQIISMEKENNM